MDDQKQYFVELIEQNKSIFFKFCYMYSTDKKWSIIFGKNNYLKVIR